MRYESSRPFLPGDTPGRNGRDDWILKGIISYFALLALLRRRDDLLAFLPTVAPDHQADANQDHGEA